MLWSDTPLVADIGLSAAIAGGVTTALLFLLLALRKPWARGERGTDVGILEYGRGLKAFAVLGVGFASFMTFVAAWGYFMTPDFGGWTPGLVLTVVGSIWLIAGPLAVEVFGAWCRFSPSLIVRHSSWKGTLSVRWEEIEWIRYDMSSERYLIRTPRGTIHLHNYLDGLPEFVELARSRIPAERWGKPKR